MLLKYTAIWTLVLIVLSGCLSTNAELKQGAESLVPLDHLPALAGDYYVHDSDAVGRPLHIYIRLPQGYDEDTSGHYPVVYLLDGDSLFPILASNHLFLTYDDKLPEAIVVGIAYGSFDPSVNRRGYDFSAQAEDANEEQGGADRFLQFLKTELIPDIEQRYRTDPTRRILFGQSRGGYLVLYSGWTDPDLFWGRIASNPVLVPGRERFFAPANAATRNDLGLVVTSGSEDHPEFRRSVLEWFAHWHQREDIPWSLHTATIEGGTHSADSMASYRLGLRWLFDRPGSLSDLTGRRKEKSI